MAAAPSRFRSVSEDDLLKERQDILSSFFDGLNYGYKVLRNLKIMFAKEEKHQRGDSKEKGTRMAEDCED